jgi:hypothetical protein
MVAGENCEAWEGGLATMGEARRRRGKSTALLAKRVHDSLECDRAEGNDYSEVRQAGEVFEEVRMAAGNLQWKGLVLRRGAMHDRRDVQVIEA